MDSSVAAIKAALRAQALAARAHGGDADALSRNLTGALADAACLRLAGYWPMRGEADPRPAMQAHDGPVCLPVVPGRAMPLTFRLWTGQPLEAGPLGTSHPGDDAPLVVPDVLIVPLVAFDGGLNRLGYGGGYYDRTLAALRTQNACRAIGLAWDCQRVAAIPTEATDERLDMIVTDTGILRAE